MSYTPAFPTISSPFNAKSTAEEVSSNIDLSGKIALVTGGTKGGLGYETARVLALRGAHVFITARDEKKGSEAVAELIKQTGNKKIEFLVIRLDDLNNVREGLKPFVDRNLPLHILILNAGIMTPASYGKTVQGFEQQFGINHVGHFLVTHLLLPQLKAAKGARVVSLSSSAHKWGGPGIQWENIDFSAPNTYDKVRAYGHSKLANILFANELDRRYRKNNIRAFSVHPGVIMTDLARDLTQEELQKWNLIDENGKTKDWLKSIPQGASTTIFAAISPLLDGHGGFYLEDNNIAVLNSDDSVLAGAAPRVYDEKEEKKLWEESEKWIGVA